MAVTVFRPPVRSYMTFDQVPDPIVAAKPFTKTLATHPVSDTVPDTVGNPLTVELFNGELMAITGGVVSPVPVVQVPIVQVPVVPVPVLPLSFIVKERTLDAEFRFHARSEKTPVPVTIVIVPEETLGIAVKTNPVELS